MSYRDIEKRLIERTARKVLHILHLEEPEVIEDGIGVVLLYSNLSVMFGGDEELARHWLRTYNRHLQYVPADRAKYKIDLKMTNTYLESLINY